MPSTLPAILALLCNACIYKVRSTVAKGDDCEGTSCRAPGGSLLQRTVLDRNAARVLAEPADETVVTYPDDQDNNSSSSTSDEVAMIGSFEDFTTVVTPARFRSATTSKCIICDGNDRKDTGGTWCNAKVKHLPKDQRAAECVRWYVVMSNRADRSYAFNCMWNSVQEACQALDHTELVVGGPCGTSVPDACAQGTYVRSTDHVCMQCDGVRRNTEGKWCNENVKHLTLSERIVDCPKYYTTWMDPGGYTYAFNCAWNAVRLKCEALTMTKLLYGSPCGTNVDNTCACASSPTPTPASTQSCQEETSCPAQATTVLCDSSAWRQSEKCKCSCQKLKPHLVWLLIDDMGFNDFVGSSDLSRAWSYVNSQLPNAIHVDTSYAEIKCGPSRSAILSGRWRQNVWDGTKWGSFSSVSESTLPTRLLSSDYKSYAIGKWHVGSDAWSTSPVGRGFLRYFGNLENGDHAKQCANTQKFDLHYMESEHFEQCWSTSSNPYHYYPVADIGTYKTDLYSRKAKQFIAEHKNKYCVMENGIQRCKPMFLYYAMFAMHAPFEDTPETWTRHCGDSFASRQNANRVQLCGMAFALDNAVKDLNEALSSAFGGDNYLVLITSDNGGPTWRATAAANNIPLRGGKGEHWDGGVRGHALLMGKHPELSSSAVKGKTYAKGFVHQVDWHATFLQLGHATPLTAGAPPEDLGSAALPAKSLWSTLLNNAASPRTEWLSVEEETKLGWQYHWQPDVYTHWKLMNAPRGGWPDEKRTENTGYVWPVRNYDNVQYMADHIGSNEGYMYSVTSYFLYNLTKDPSESHDVKSQFPHVANTMLQKFNTLVHSGRFSNGYENNPCTNEDPQPDYDINFAARDQLKNQWAQDCGPVAPGSCNPSHGAKCQQNKDKLAELDVEASQQVRSRTQCATTSAVYPYWEETVLGAIRRRRQAKMVER